MALFGSGLVVSLVQTLLALRGPGAARPRRDALRTSGRSTTFATPFTFAHEIGSARRVVGDQQPERTALAAGSGAPSRLCSSTPWRSTESGTGSLAKPSPATTTALPAAGSASASNSASMRAARAAALRERAETSAMPPGSAASASRSTSVDAAVGQHELDAVRVDGGAPRRAAGRPASAAPTRSSARASLRAMASRAAVAPERGEAVVQHAARDLEPLDALLGAEDALEARDRRVGRERRERVAQAPAEKTTSGDQRHERAWWPAVDGA